MAAPGATDLYARGDQYYLDLPGNPRDAGCDYEQWFDANSDGYDPTTYAHIVSNGTDQLAIQYWFFYVFNNFNNTHESDWEMIQILFEVGTAEEALQADPVSIALAQHGGGETADWTDDKLQRDGTHPIVYSAAGSHATQYGNAVYLGWGENGTGFGCDITTGPTTLVPLNAVLLPATQPDPNGDYAWLNFAGRWGERRKPASSTARPGHRPSPPGRARSSGRPGCAIQQSRGAAGEDVRTCPDGRLLHPLHVGIEPVPGDRRHSPPVHLHRLSASLPRSWP